MINDQKNVSRRSFVARASVAAAAAAASIAHPAFAGEATSPCIGTGNVPESWDLECDLLVAGAGGAGMTTACVAATNGAQTIVLESQESVYTSATFYSFGHYSAVNTDEQAAAGIEDSPENLEADMLAWGGVNGDYPSAETLCNRNLIKLFCENCEQGYRMLKDWGMEFSDVYKCTGSTINRTFEVKPLQMCQILEEKCLEAGVTFMFNTALTELIVDGAGTVVGAFAVDAEGNRIAIKARKATVLATGTFLYNDTMVEEMLPGASKVDKVTALGGDGSGHLAAMQLGAAVWGRNNLYFVEGYSLDDSWRYCELTEYGAIEVNDRGERFMDEGTWWNNDRSRKLSAQGVNEQTGTFTAWYVADQKVYDAAWEDGAPLGITEEIDELLVKGDTIEELAEKMGAPALPETLARYNADLEAGGDSAFHREHLNGSSTDSPFALTEPPYYAWHHRPVLMFAPPTGLLDDDEFHPLDQFGRPIGGGRLFALGELSMRSIEGNNYLVGTATSSCVTFGMIAGERIAAMDSWE